MTVLMEASRESWSKGYWLEHCTGFRVDGPRGHLGYVDQVLLDPDGHTPRALVVRGARTTVVSVGEVVRLEPEHELVQIGKTRLNGGSAPLVKVEGG